MLALLNPFEQPQNTKASSLFYFVNPVPPPPRSPTETLGRWEWGGYSFPASHSWNPVLPKTRLNKKDMLYQTVEKFIEANKRAGKGAQFVLL